MEKLNNRSGSSAESRKLAAVCRRAATILALAFSLQPSAFSATVTGLVQTAATAGYKTNLLFTPLSTPLQSGNNLIASAPTNVITDSAGAFSVPLNAGDYLVNLGNLRRDSFFLSVPTNAATYNFLSLITNSLTYTFSANPSYELLINKAIPSGYASLDSNGNVPLSQLGNAPAIAGSSSGDSNAFYLTIKTSNSLPNSFRLIGDMATILQLTNGADIIHRVSDSISNWGRFSTNMVSDTATNAAQNIAAAKIASQGGLGTNNVLTDVTLQNTASIFSPALGATFPFIIEQSGNHLVFQHPDTSDQVLMTATGLVGNASGITNLPTSLTNATHFDPTAGSKGLKTWSAGNGIGITNETGSNLVAAIDPAIVASQANLTSASNTLRTAFVSNDTTTSNGLVTLLVANDTTTSNGVVTLLVANDTVTSNGVVTLLVANDTFTSNALKTAISDLQNATNRFGDTNRFIASDSGKGTNNSLRTPTLASATASRAAIIDAQGILSNSVVTTTELGLLSGLTSLGAGLPTLPAAPMYGAQISTDGTNALWTIDANGAWIVNEDWLGDVTSTTTGQAGAYGWVLGTTGTLPSLVAPITESSAIGYISCVTTQSTCARGWFLGPAAGYIMLATNMEVFFLARTRIGQTNISGDVTTHRIGIGNNGGGTTEWASGIYTMVNTNVNTNTYVFVTSRAGTRTITYSSHAANTNDAMSMGWMVTGFYLDRTGTNVIFYVGPTETNLTAVATNVLTMPNSQMVAPNFIVNRIASSAGTVFRTNYCDWIRMWLRKI